MAEYIERDAVIATIAKHMASVNEHCYSVNHSKEQYDIYAMATNHAIDYVRCVPAADVAPVVRCRDCFWYKPAHFAADDGKEYEWDGTMTLYARSDGIHVGGKCKHDRNTAYGEKDMAFRNPDDFCSYGEWRHSDD